MTDHRKTICEAVVDATTGDHSPRALAVADAILTAIQSGDCDVMDWVAVYVRGEIAEAEKRWSRAMSNSSPEGARVRLPEGPDGSTPLAGGGSNEPALIDQVWTELGGYACAGDTLMVALRRMRRCLVGDVEEADRQLDAERAAHSETRKELEAMTATAEGRDRAYTNRVEWGERLQSELAETKAKLVSMAESHKLSMANLATADRELHEAESKLAELIRVQSKTFEHLQQERADLATAVEALESASERLRDRKLASDVMAILQEALRAIRGNQTSGTGRTVAGQQRPQDTPPAGAPGEAGTITLTPMRRDGLDLKPKPEPKPGPGASVFCPKDVVPLSPEEARELGKEGQAWRKELQAKPEPAMARAAVGPGAQPPRPMPPPPEPAKCTCGHEPGYHCNTGCHVLGCPCTWNGRTDGGEK